ncbi:inactive protein restricted tev movement 1 [Phtheirospermum japonicum]|uniref:Inactive protein restricted tev movement 1 n=1 Tax=Phtheirospermum japonicum TaxID=374723 RepID=A0A830BDQ7_9LAMI|nr:inactive protein restricted tev movement 1 [Phtheirospermum japonicum]
MGSGFGNKWDEKGHNQIVQIFICHGYYVNSIQFQYAENGNRVLSTRHGEGSNNNGSKLDAVKLNYPSEYITWISGKKNKINGYLQSITFGTNRGEYGPFGQSPSCSNEFTFRLGERQFGGFHGTADSLSVTSIGVYLKPITI